MLKKIAVLLMASIAFFPSVYAEGPIIGIDYNSVITVADIPAGNEEALIIWISDDSEKTVYANMYSADEYTNDIRIFVPGLEIGDRLSVSLTGAYTYSTTLEYSKALIWEKFKEEYDKTEEASVNKLLSEYSDYIDSKYLDSYLKLNAATQSKVLSVLVNSELTSFEDIKSIIDVQTKNALDASKSNSSGSSSGGGGGGSGGGAAISGSHNNSYNIGNYKTSQAESTEPPVLVHTETSTEAPTEAPQKVIPILDEEPDPFDDMGTVPWADESIMLLKKLNIVNGSDDNNFYPLKEVTRAEFIKMLVMTFDEPDKTLKCSFSDISESDWYYDYIALAQEFGLAEGNDNLFAPNETITRQDAAVLIWRFCEFYKKEMISDKAAISFSDAEAIADYAKIAIDELVRSGIINGMDDGSFLPVGTCNRAMAAKMIAKVIIDE